MESNRIGGVSLWQPDSELQWSEHQVIRQPWLLASHSPQKRLHYTSRNPPIVSQQPGYLHDDAYCLANAAVCSFHAPLHTGTPWSPFPRVTEACRDAPSSRVAQAIR